MQFTKPYKQAIAAGTLTRTYRRWKSPQAKVDGTYNIHPYGAILVTSISQLRLQDASIKDIQQSGFDSANAIAEHLKTSLNETVYCVHFRYIGTDAVKQIDTGRLPTIELEAISIKLMRMNKTKLWTHHALRLVRDQPAKRAADLAPILEMDLPTFKRNMRKLKNLGLTLSLETGYQITARGTQMIAHANETK